MKTIFVIVLFCSFVFAQNKTIEKRTTTDSTGNVVTTESVIISQTEDITPRTSMIVINPLKFFLFYNISYYTKIKDNIVVGGGVQMPTLHDMSGFGINAELRYHPSKKAMRGFYIAPNISVSSLSTNSSNSSTSSISIGILAGWQWFPSAEFAMGFGIGVDEYFLTNGKSEGFGSYNGAVPAVRFDIGYAW